MIQLMTVALQSEATVCHSSEWQLPHIGRGGWRIVWQAEQCCSSSSPAAIPSQ